MTAVFITLYEDSIRLRDHCNQHNIPFIVLWKFNASTNTLFTEMIIKDFGFIFNNSTGSVTLSTFQEDFPTSTRVRVDAFQP